MILNYDKHKMKTIIVAIAIMFEVSDSIAQWTKINSIPTQQIVALASFGDTILAASGTNLLYRSIDNGINWNPITVSSTNISITTLDIIDNTIYTGTSSKGIFYSTNYGLNWMKKGGNLLTVSGIEKKGSELYAATLGDGVFAFDENSNSWIPFNNSLPTYSVNVFTILATTGSLLIGAGANGTLYLYDFNNSQWIEGFYYGSLKPGLIIYELINYSNTIIAVNGNRIIRSDDEGLTWTDDDAGSHDGISRNIYEGNVYFYTLTNRLNGGIWIQKRNKLSSTGTDWSANEELIPDGFSYDILEFKNKLFLARADGLYIKDLALGSENPLSQPSDVELFPNPSDGSIINISSENQINRLTISNILGQIEYSAIVNNNKLTVRPNLEKGVYLINLNMSSGTNIIKKIIIK